MYFGVESYPRKPMDSILELATTADRLDFDYMWVADHYNNRNVYVTLALIAERTEKIKIGPGATNPYTIHPAETASSIATIDEVSEGRSVLGIAPGDKSTLKTLGLEWKKPLTRTKESIEIIKELLAGDIVNTKEFEEFNLHECKLNLSPESEIPMYIGAQGPNMLRMAANKGDGILINASHPKDFEYAVEKIEEGVKESGRNLENVDIAAYSSFSVDENRKSAKEAVARPVAFIVAGVPEKVLERHEISPETANKIAGFLADEKFGPAFEAVTDKMIEAFSIYGTPEDCVERIEELREIGVTQIITGSPIGPERKNSMKIISEKIMPKF